VTTLLEQFEEKWKPYLGDTVRWTAFSFIAADLLAKPNPVIVETGTLRQPGNFRGDGQSTRLWDWIAKKTGGLAISTDIDLDYCRTAARLCPNVRVNQGDSVAFLRGYLPAGIDLLYLDAFDYSEGQEISSMMHHAAELAAVWDQLPSGCLIAIDDCHSAASGKHALVREILHFINVHPEVTGYINVWRRP
jgi:hypothetical protein